MGNSSVVTVQFPRELNVIYPSLSQLDDFSHWKSQQKRINHVRAFLLLHVVPVYVAIIHTTMNSLLGFVKLPGWQPLKLSLQKCCWLRQDSSTSAPRFLVKQLLSSWRVLALQMQCFSKKSIFCICSCSNSFMGCLQSWEISDSWN